MKKEKTTGCLIKVQKVEDNTAEFVEILVHLPGGTDPEQAIQARHAALDIADRVARHPL